MKPATMRHVPYAEVESSLAPRADIARIETKTYRLNEALSKSRVNSAQQEDLWHTGSSGGS